jgi:hypothetical protein
MRNVKIAVVLCIVISFALPCSATLVDLTVDGLNLSEGNYGQSLSIGDYLTITALTQIQNNTSQTGTIYLDGNKGLGVQTLDLGGSKGISGGGGDQDEAVVFSFASNYIAVADSISIGLNDYDPGRDDPVISVTLSNGEELFFDESHQNWDNAISDAGHNKALISLGTLLGINNTGTVTSFSVMEPTGHLYVNGVGYTGSEVPEPATMFLLSMGGFFLAKQRKVKGI